MALIIDFLDETATVKEDYLSLIIKVLEIGAQQECIEEAEISVTFVDNKRMQEINYMYRQINRPTNVLSFPMEESILDETRFIKCKTHSMLGDIIISIPKAKEQAKEYGHSFEREISFLTVHGFLHLIGYDHQTEKEETIMFKKQEEVLAICGLKR